MNNGYTQIEIGGKTIGIKFGLPALQWMINKNASFPDIMKSDAMFNSYLLYYGYLNNCGLNDTLPEHKIDFFMEYVDSVSGDAELAKPLAAVIEIWAASREVKRITPQKEDDAVKKKNGEKMKSKAIATVASA